MSKEYLKDFINKNYAQHQLLLPDENDKNNNERLINHDNKYDSIESSNLELNSYEQKLIDRLENAYKYARKTNQLDFSILNNKKNAKISKESLASFLIQPIKRVITFANLIPDFKALSLNDQFILIHEGAIEIIICSSSSLYDMNLNMLFDTMNFSHIQSNSMKFNEFLTIWNKELFEKTINYLKSMSDLKLDETILIIYLCLILFQPERVGLNDSSQVLKTQFKYSTLLKKQLYKLYENNFESNRLIEELSNKHCELSNLNKLHKLFLNDIDQTKLEPIVKSILNKN